MLVIEAWTNMAAWGNIDDEENKNVCILIRISPKFISIDRFANKNNSSSGKVCRTANGWDLFEYFIRRLITTA